LLLRGLSLAAAARGATSVLGVDSSGAALDLARRNAELNKLEGKVEFIQVRSRFIYRGRTRRHKRAGGGLVWGSARSCEKERGAG
jgi:23S rRNA G2069 N7-methylase RlmK/C1962 C5-methylase RlmI